MKRFTLILAAASLAAQTRTTNDGVYSDAQAARGEAIYATTCNGCHGDQLQGKSDGPLRGQVFMDRWREDSLDTLFNHVRVNMPARAPGTLPESTYLDLVAFILKTNGFRAGAADLAVPALPGILLVGKDGPQPLPTNATVRAVGCLTAAGTNWTLTSTSNPLRTAVGDQITPAEEQSARPTPPGTLTFQLRNLDDLSIKPENWKGHKVLAKGVLNRLSAGDRIHVLAMADLAASCAP